MVQRGRVGENGFSLLRADLGDTLVVVDGIPRHGLSEPVQVGLVLGERVAGPYDLAMRGRDVELAWDGGKVLVSRHGYGVVWVLGHTDADEVISFHVLFPDRCLKLHDLLLEAGEGWVRLDVFPVGLVLRVEVLSERPSMRHNEEVVIQLPSLLDLFNPVPKKQIKEAHRLSPITELFTVPIAVTERDCPMQQDVCVDEGGELLHSAGTSSTA